MATKKTSKKAPVKAKAKKTAAAKTETKTTVKRVVTESVAAKSERTKLDSKLPNNLINIVIAEIVGTFILTLAALFSASILAPFYVGLTLMLIVMAIGGISGAHINPAVTFGLWSMRKLKTVLVPFYWGAQFLGAMAAVVLIGGMTEGGFSVRFDQFTNFSWSIFAIEMIGTAIFMFGLAAVLSRTNLKLAGRSVGIGMALAIGLVVSSTLLSYVQNAVFVKHTKTASSAQKTEEGAYKNYPREVHIGGATLNPAVALAVTEKTDTQIQSSNPLTAENEKSYSRLSLEVISATLIGAALGGNLFLLVNYRNKDEA